MKKIVNKIKQNAKAIAAFLLGIVLTGGTVYAATVLPSSQVGYDNSTSGLAATDVQGALDELYEKSERNCKPGFFYEIEADGYSCNRYKKYILLTVNGDGARYVLSESFAELPNEVIINGKYMDVAHEYYFTDQNNTVKLVWNNAINSTASMFQDCSDITRIDLSSFDTRSVTNMNGMFYNASSLTSLDLSDWNTSNVKYMNYMFANASSLTSLDLSDWDTSNVQFMNNMFYGANPNLQVTINCENTNLINQINGDLGSGHYTCAN